LELRALHQKKLERQSVTFLSYRLCYSELGYALIGSRSYLDINPYVNSSEIEQSAAQLLRFKYV